MPPVTLRAATPRALVPALLAAMLCAPAHAIDVGDRVAIHGYGHTSYFREDGSGSWDDSLVSILFVGEISDKSKVWIQLHNTTEFSHLDWAFVDYHLTPHLTARGGQIKLPFGLYNEIIDSRFLQLSTRPPMLYQDETGFASENFRGGDVSYALDVGGGNVSLTGYAGSVARSPETPDTTQYHRLVGANVTWQTPVEGLRFMLSGYSSRVEENDTNLIAHGVGNNNVAALSLDYVANNWDIKAEAAHATFVGKASRTAYLQAGYAVAESWTPFVRYDWAHFDNGSGPQSAQRTLSAGVSYRVTDGIALRVEDHYSHGNAVAWNAWRASNPGGPLDPQGAPTRSNSNAVGVSVLFIF